jgi:hypothetical protein
MSGVYTIQIKSSDLKKKNSSLNDTTLNKMGKSGRLKFKMIKGVKYYENNSVNQLNNTFNRDDYYTDKEVMGVLEDNGLLDKYFPVSNEKNSKGKKVGGYKRILNKFPISINQLSKHKILEVDTDFSPRLIKKSEVVKCIKTLNNMVKKGL